MPSKQQTMFIEISIEEKVFLIKWLPKTYLKGLEKKFKYATVHPECDEYIECEFTRSEVEDMVGELSYEANHGKSARTAAFACDLADSLEMQWREAE